jgi:hypothetical protein
LEAERNVRRATIDWQFTVGDARAKLKKHYPAVESRLSSASRRHAPSPHYPFELSR